MEQNSTNNQLLIIVLIAVLVIALGYISYLRVFSLDQAYQAGYDKAVTNIKERLVKEGEGYLPMSDFTPMILGKVLSIQSNNLEVETVLLSPFEGDDLKSRNVIISTETVVKRIVPQDMASNTMLSEPPIDPIETNINDFPSPFMTKTEDAKMSDLLEGTSIIIFSKDNTNIIGQKDIVASEIHIISM